MNTMDKIILWNFEDKNREIWFSYTVPEICEFRVTETL